MSPKVDLQFKILDRVYFVDFDELAEKIKNGNILRHDPVKIGGSIWTDAENIPALAKIFEEEEARNKIPVGVDFQNIPKSVEDADTDEKALRETEKIAGKVCAIHTDQSTLNYACAICENSFCRECPGRNPGKSPLCVFCANSGTGFRFYRRIFSVFCFFRRFVWRTAKIKPAQCEKALFPASKR